MRALHVVTLIAVFALAGCDRITGAADQKILDAQAIGYACRISMKVPEDCMKENETQSPTYVLNGWKEADRDINERVIDPSMGKRAAAATAHNPPAAKVASKPETEPAAAAKAPDAKVAAEAKVATANKTTPVAKVDTANKKPAGNGKDALVKKPAP